MSSKRRSCRRKKIVDYSQYGGKNDSDVCSYESDDDFEGDFGPPSKKAKVKNHDGKNKSSRTESQKITPKERQSLDDKLYERDVQKALQLSMQSRRPSSQEPKEKNRKTHHLREQEQSEGDTSSEVERSSQDTIETSSQDKNENERGDSDYDPKQEPGSESEEESDYDEVEDENDHDFAGEEKSKKPTLSKRKTKAKTKSKPTSIKKSQVDAISKQSVKTKPQEKQKTIETVIPSRPSENSQSILSGKKAFPTVRCLVSTTATSRSPPVGLGGVVIKNPGPPIRVGLSRNIKVKPLHPKVSVAH